MFVNVTKDMKWETDNVLISTNVNKDYVPTEYVETMTDHLSANVQPDFICPRIENNARITTNVNKPECVPMESVPIWTDLSSVTVTKVIN